MSGVPRASVGDVAASAAPTHIASASRQAIRSNWARKGMQKRKLISARNWTRVEGALLTMVEVVLQRAIRRRGSDSRGNGVALLAATEMRNKRAS